MTFSLGHLAFGLSLILAAMQSLAPAIKRLRLMQSVSVLQFLSLLGAFFWLVHAFMVSDFSVLCVALNSHSLSPLIYKITAVWGNHEGSMLLWLLLMSGYTAGFAITKTQLERSHILRIVGIQGVMSLVFHLFIFLTSNPFIVVDPAPLQGQGLNPILEDIGLAIHPPLLYLGYVGCSLAFSHGYAALLGGKISEAWSQSCRYWTLIAWSFLSIGIAWGSWWAYYELGWGGWWFWDPVENAALMPWILATALVHSLIVTQKRGMLSAWTLCLCLLTFAFCLIGTFLVRSGVLTSVHSFAVDPARGVFILMMILGVVGAGLSTFAIKGAAFRSKPFQQVVSREVTLYVNNVLLVTLCLIIFMGTIYPLLVQAFDGPQITVGAPYFNTVVIPLALPLLAIMAISPRLAWQKADAAVVLKRLATATTIGLAGAVLVLYVYYGGPIIAAVAFGLASWLAAATGMHFIEKYKASKSRPWGLVGMSLAHLGIAISVMGMSIDVLGHEKVAPMMRIGDTTTFRGQEITLSSVDVQGGPYYSVEDAVIMVDGTMASPQKRYYGVQQVMTTETSLLYSGLSNLYIALGQFIGDDTWVVRLDWHPYVLLIWIGGILMMFGGLVSAGLLRRKKYV
ncbi:MAG: heme lyase CcmF/NrfE family subunit [Alphaproteobacteria bacterium]